MVIGTHYMASNTRLSHIIGISREQHGTRYRKKKERYSVRDDATLCGFGRLEMSTDRMYSSHQEMITILGRSCKR